MNLELIQVKDNQIFTTSYLIAEKFEKEHRKVIRAIEILTNQLRGVAKNVHTPYFEKCTEINPQNNQCYTMYYMNRDAFSLLVMGFNNNNKKVLEWKLKFIRAFNEMEKQLKTPRQPLQDDRLEIARLISRTNKAGINLIRELYPEYFAPKVDTDSFEYICDTNTTYTEWINDCGITKDWLLSFPTKEIFNNYQRYCTDNKVTGLGKKTFYSTLEQDFNLGRKQRKDGFRYFD